MWPNLKILSRPRYINDLIYLTLVDKVSIVIVFNLLGKSVNERFCRIGEASRNVAAATTTIIAVA